ncbi:MAG: hypothetical protein U1D41_11265 [Nitrosomonas sp.]|uniref:hypothetical protein n=1 Tax=Nitrosomonas sp. TaxID=42353 RepID=UPI002AB8DC6E|nr:hypothetical protein [Nitrosomonas sp.]MDZ4106719.1 hypothetical protein [Nitrosomonas sp.]
MDDEPKALKQEFYKWNERHTFIKLIVLLLIVFLLITLLLTIFYPQIIRENRLLVVFLISVLGGIFLFASVYYLQIGFKTLENSNTDYIKLDSIKDELAQLRETVSHANLIQEAITSEHRDELVALLKTELVNKSVDLASQQVIEKIENKISKSYQFNEIEGVLLKTLERLYKEIDALSRRGNLNLSLGILTTITGLVILGYFVLEIDSFPEDKMAFIAYFIPRLSLVILIEVFAYFFLRLYKSSLSEIKYFQNEMTNVEARLAAIKCSIMMPDTATISDVIRSLSNTERNAVLEKGQTTAEIERAKIEQQNITTISEKVSSILGMKK